MRRSIFAVLLVALTALCSAAPVHAETCSVDKSVTAGGVAYDQCPYGATNNYLLGEGYNSARLETDVHLSKTPIYAHNICRYTDARSTTAPLFVPFNSESEWQAFIANKPAGVDVVQCCVPRGMRTSDVPEPTEVCTDGAGGGYWRLTGLVDPNDNSVFLAKPQTTASDALLILQGGVTENEAYPITTLPIDRDDIASVVPKSNSSNYVGRWLCSFGRKPVSVDSAPAAATSSPASLDIGAVVYTSFKLQCRSGDWRPEDCQSGQIGSLIEEACPSGEIGKVTKRLVLQCPSRTIVEQLVSDTCQACDHEVLLRTETEACPSGQTGQKLYEVYKIYYSQNGQCLSREERRLKSNTCTSCAREETLPDEVKACPAGQSGTIVYSVKKVYYAEGGQCLYRIEKTLKSNTCQVCDREESLPNEVKACPAGQDGAITYSVKKVYYVNTTTHQCEFKLVKTLISNTCVAVCEPETKTEVKKCKGDKVGPGITKVYTRGCNEDGTHTDWVLKKKTGYCIRPTGGTTESPPSSGGEGGGNSESGEGGN